MQLLLIHASLLEKCKHEQSPKPSPLCWTFDIGIHISNFASNMSEETMNMRKRFSDYQPKTPAKKRFVSPPSSPLHPVPKFTEQSPSNRPSFNPVGGLPFDRKIRPGLPHNAFDVFALFCPDSMVEEWVNYVNIRRDGPHWRPTSKEEIHLFFGGFLYMSYIPLSSIHLYWETSDIATSYPITRFISRTCFLDIYRRFCTWDPTGHISSVFEKVKPWSTHIKDVSKHWWRPSSNISVDEAMIRFTGRSKDIVRLPNKPDSVDYNIWITADSGFIIDFMYHSKDKEPIDYSKATCPKLAPTQGVVVNMLAIHCFLDNLFSSPKLMDRLREMDIAATGTTRPNRVDSEQLSTMKSSEKSRDRIPWGTVYAGKHKEEEVMQVGFKDNAFVLLLSAAFDGWEQPVITSAAGEDVHQRKDCQRAIQRPVHDETRNSSHYRSVQPQHERCGYRGPAAVSTATEAQNRRVL